MRLDITPDNSPQCPDQLVHLTRVGTPNGVGNTDTVHTDLVDCAVDGEEVDQFGTERVFRGETDFDALGLDELDDLDSAEVSYMLGLNQSGKGRLDRENIKTGRLTSW